MTSHRAVCIRKQLSLHGFAHLPRFRRGFSTLIVAAELGAIESISGISSVHKLSPLSEAEAPPNTYSGTYDLREFPLHTDMAHWHVPPHYLLLRCVVPEPRVLTSLLSASQILFPDSHRNCSSRTIPPSKACLRKETIAPFSSKA